MWASIEPWASEFFGEDYYIWDYSPPRHFMWAVARWHAFWFSQLAVVEYTNQFYVDFHHDGRNDERHDMVTLRVMDPNGEWMKDIMLPPFVLE